MLDNQQSRLTETEFEAARDLKRSKYPWKMILSKDEIADIAEVIIATRTMDTADWAERLRADYELEKTSIRMNLDYPKATSAETKVRINRRLDEAGHTPISEQERIVIQEYMYMHGLKDGFLTPRLLDEMVRFVLHFRRSSAWKKKKSRGMGIDINSLEFCKVMDEALAERYQHGISTPELAVLEQYIQRHNLFGRVLDKAPRTRLANFIINYRRVMSDTYEPTTDDTRDTDTENTTEIPPHISNENTFIRAVDAYLHGRGIHGLSDAEKNEVLGMFMKGLIRTSSDHKDVDVMMEDIHKFIHRNRDDLTGMTMELEKWNFNKAYGSIFCRGCGSTYHGEHKRGCKYTQGIMQPKTEG